jgi:serine/threonine-protein kinase
MVAQSNDNQAHGLDEVLTRFVNAYVRDEKPDIDEFVKQYPQLEEQIRRRVEGLCEIDSLFESLVQSDQSDFYDVVTVDEIVGQRIGDFEIVSIIGRGGMGVVYRARDTKLDRTVAIKSIPPELAGSSTARMRFRREAKLLASLNHPNIAVIHEIIEEEESGYLVLEYVPGETLAERVAREPLELDEALSIGQQIAEAVSAAHKKGIVHRDLKPRNIKITPEGRVKVLDFGLAKISISEGKDIEATATHLGRVIGTPAYMSPEQARGKETDQRTDIWSFGCIMYQMLSGNLPFEGETATDTLARIIEREPDWQTLPKQIPSNIRTLLKRCLEKDTDRRLVDISDVVIEISETLRTLQLTLPVRLRSMAITVGTTIIIILSAVGAWFVLGEKDIGVVVLPFETMKSVEDEEFTDGITSDITDLLAKIHKLSVISYRSAIQYKQTDKTTREIADDLRVDYILEGTVKYEHPLDANSLVSITSRLINISKNIQVWSKTYDRTRNEVSKIPFDVVRQVAQATDIKLSPVEQQALAYMPTYNTEAYYCYVRGNSYFSLPFQNEENLKSAVEWYEEATNLDDTFALAHAKLSVAYSGMYHFRDDRSEERLATAWKASEKALELDPELSEAHWARGVYYYWGRSDYVRALDELQIAQKSQPNNSELLAMIGYIQRRQGKYQQALVNIKRASELNPLDSRLAVELGHTFRDVRKYPEAKSYYERAISLAPDDYYPYYCKAGLYLVWNGSTQEARTALETIPEYINLADKQSIVNLWFRLDVLEGNYQGALARLPLTSPSTDALDYPVALRYAQVYGFIGNQELEKEFYEKLRSILESKVKEYPNSCGFHCLLGIAYAGLGRRKEAIQGGRYGVKLVPYNMNSLAHFNATKDLATIYMMVGDYDEAIDKIKYLLKIPGALSIPLLKIDPLWDPLREHPRFQKLLESYK